MTAIGLLLLFTLAPLGVALAPKPWHRVCLMLLVGLGVVVFVNGACTMQRKMLAAETYQLTLRPTQALWNRLDELLREGKVDVAMRDVKFIRERWLRIVPANPTNTIELLLRDLKELEESQPSARPSGSPAAGSPSGQP